MTVNLHEISIMIQHSISFSGIFIIFIGVVIALIQFVYHFVTNRMDRQNSYINTIRLRLGRVIILGLEFIIAADLIGTTTTPDYYDLGILAIIVVIRTVLSYTLNREIDNLAKEQGQPTTEAA
jgi:uncharacterized membrane protein